MRNYKIIKGTHMKRKTIIIPFVGQLIKHKSYVTDVLGVMVNALTSSADANASVYNSKRTGTFMFTAFPSKLKSSFS